MIHTQAAIQTAKILGGATLIGLTMGLIFMFVPIMVILGTLVVCVLLFLVKVVYDVQKSKLEAQAERQKMMFR